MFNHHPFVAEPLTLHDSQWPSQKPEVSKFPELLDLYREEIKGDRCNMSGSDADKIIIKVIRRIARTYVLGRNVTTITTGSLKSHQHVVDRRGVRLFGFGTILYVRPFSEFYVSLPANKTHDLINQFCKFSRVSARAMAL